MSLLPHSGTPRDPGYWELMFDAIPFPVYVAAFDTHEVICTNRLMRDRLGGMPDGKCFEAIYGQQAPCLFCRMPDLAALPPDREPCLVFDHFNDLDERWYQLREVMINWFDGRRAKYSIAVDVTAMKEVQNALAEAHAELALKSRELALKNRELESKNRDLGAAMDKAEEAAHAKSQFLAAVSHELRTPMNAIIGLAGLLLEAPHDPAQKEQLHTIAAAADHLLTLINDILDLSKIEAGKLSLAEENLDLAAVVEGVCALIAEQAHAKGLAVRSRIDPELSGRFRGDAMRLSQVLLNYAGNAVKFTAAGEVEIRARQESADEDSVRVRFEVSDTGIGISDADKARLFQAFEQADSTITRKFGGTGLGLAINRQLAQLMKGEVGVDSVPGQGSTFWFTARLARVGCSSARLARAVDGASAPAEDPALRLARVLAARPRPCRLLLVEDNLLNQRVAMAILRDHAIAIQVAENGARAVELCSAGEYDIILMDMQMPVMDGLTATRAIRTLPACARTPIVAMTANAVDDERQRCLDSGMNDYISKPVPPRVLYAALVRWLE